MAMNFDTKTLLNNLISFLYFSIKKKLTKSQILLNNDN